MSQLGELESVGKKRIFPRVADIHLTCSCKCCTKRRREERKSDPAAYYASEEGQAKLRRVIEKVMEPINGGRLVAYQAPVKGSHLNLTLVTDKTADWAIDEHYVLDYEDVCLLRVPIWFLDGSLRLH